MSTIVVAESENHVIGKANTIPWRLSNDMKHFREITENHTVVMGRKTYESIINSLGKPLPNRRNLIISTSLTQVPDGFEVFKSIKDLGKSIDLSDDFCFIIGGGQLYKSAIDAGIVNHIFLTTVHTKIDGDAFFPELNPHEWKTINKQEYKNDEKNQFDYDFIELRKM